MTLANFKLGQFVGGIFRGRRSAASFFMARIIRPCFALLPLRKSFLSPVYKKKHMAYLPNIFADNFYLASVITWRELVRYKLEDSPDPLIFWGRIVFALHKPAMEFEVVDKYRTRPFFARLATLKLTRFFFLPIQSTVTSTHAQKWNQASYEPFILLDLMNNHPFGQITSL